MEYAGSKLVREVNRLTGWSGPVFERRDSMTPVSNEVAAHREVLGLVERIVDGPGIHSAKARLLGECRAPRSSVIAFLIFSVAG